LKDKLCSIDFTKAFKIECDTSGIGLSWVNAGYEPIAYFSEKLNGGSIELPYI
jgi:hypothetical protein